MRIDKNRLVGFVGVDVKSILVVGLIYLRLDGPLQEGLERFIVEVTQRGEGS